ncbi:XRE family transcriptional regulator [Aeromicrobium phragmitis]|uniref:XRE family transcriptional regulator n=1 Tax=Aeromicrobium phragmitis TaxID=2478914 RepID=A0A3L8PK34_9ACTN|nr:XRE family transcriptional regulator [Aeromicrobium phragmitis]RLV55073.1 XRE family transcriptional regulator [Aeromicrobium phragmitis]
MEPSAAELSVVVGERVRRARIERGWTLDQLAEAGGVSRRMVVNVEQGAVNPSVGTLLRLSDALGIGLPALVEPPEPRTIKVTRAGGGAVLWRSDAGGEGVLVAGTERPDVLELWQWTLAPGDRHRSEAHAAGTKEALQVLEGTLVMEVSEQSVTLGEGDAMSFSGDVAHSYANHGHAPCRYALTVFEPSVGVASGGGH